MWKFVLYMQLQHKAVVDYRYRSIYNHNNENSTLTFGEQEVININEKWLDSGWNVYRQNNKYYSSLLIRYDIYWCNNMSPTTKEQLLIWKKK